jgi:hypothetical protein
MTRRSTLLKGSDVKKGRSHVERWGKLSLAAMIMLGRRQRTAPPSRVALLWLAMPWSKFENRASDSQRAAVAVGRRRNAPVAAAAALEACTPPKTISLLVEWTLPHDATSPQSHSYPPLPISLPATSTKYKWRRIIFLFYQHLIKPGGLALILWTCSAKLLVLGAERPELIRTGSILWGIQSVCAYGRSWHRRSRDASLLAFVIS